MTGRAPDLHTICAVGRRARTRTSVRWPSSGLAGLFQDRTEAVDTGRIEGPRSTERTILGGYDMGSLEWADIRLVGSVGPSGARATQARMVLTSRSFQDPTKVAVEILATDILENVAALICGTGWSAPFLGQRHWLGSAIPRKRL